MTILYFVQSVCKRILLFLLKICAWITGLIASILTKEFSYKKHSIPVWLLLALILLVLGVGLGLYQTCFKIHDNESSVNVSQEIGGSLFPDQVYQMPLLLDDAWIAHVDAGLTEEFCDELTDEVLLTLIESTHENRAITMSAYQIARCDDIPTSSKLKTIKLGINDPLAAPFLDGFVQHYLEDDAQPYTDSVSKGVIPRLYQWDTRWGYTEYSSDAFGLSGCCPTSLSMVYMGLTGKTDKTPYDMGRLAVDLGCVSEKDGTYADFLIRVAPELGLYCEKFDPDTTKFISCLEQGCPVILNVGPGDFTDGGHFIVACGLTEEGNIVINDPFSSVKSDQAWDADVLIGQTMSMYVFSTEE